MSVTDQQMLDKAKDSLARILDTDTRSWTKGDKQQHALEIDRLERLIEKYERRVTAANGNRQIFSPIRRIDL